MISYAFNYHRAKSLADAQALFSRCPDPKYLAGGQTLIPTMKQRLASPSDVIDISALDELSFIRVTPDSVVIGAGTTHHAAATSQEIARAVPALAVLAEGIGDPAVRHLGTVGGSVANSDPAADYPAAILGLGATIVTTRKKIPAADYFLGLFQTALEDGEIVTEIHFPIVERAGYAKFSNPASRYAIVGVFAAKTMAGPRVAVTGAGPCVFRVPSMEDALAGRFEPDVVTRFSISADGLNADLHASAGYRAHLVAVMAGRAVGAALNPARTR